MLRRTMTGLALAVALLVPLAPVAASPPPPTGAWAPTGSMLVPREGGGAGNGVHYARLPNGRVLVAGGFNTESSMGVFTFALQSNYLAESEVYDPATGAWSPTGTMHESRFSPAMATLPTGKVLMAGGSGGGFGAGVFRNSAELYDPATGAWSLTAPMRDCRTQPATTVLTSGRVLVTGGNGCQGSSQATAEVYDPATATWTPVASMSTARTAHAATRLPDGRVLVSGGRSTDGLVDRIWATAEVYDPAADAWSPAGSMSLARAFHAAGLLSGGRVIVAGGSCQAETPIGPSPSLLMGCSTETAELFDPATGSWTATASMHVKRVFAGSAAVPARGNRPGRFLVAGGGKDTSAELYDPPTATWKLTAPMSAVRDDAQLVPLSSGKVLIAGGFKATSPVDYRPTATAELFSPPR